MGVWGIEAGISVLLFVMAFPIGVWFLAYHHYHRHGSFRGWSAFLTVVSFFYFAGLVAFTLFPFPQGDAYCTVREGMSYWQLIPFASVGDVVATAATAGFPAVLRTGVFLQVFFNVILLLPLGTLLAYRYRKSLGFTVLAGFGVSLLIETTQGTGVWGLFPCPYRLADVDDLITNTAGAAIGWLVGWALIRYLPDPIGDVSPDTDPPRVVRRVFAVAIDFVVFIVFGLVAQVVLIEGAIMLNGGSEPGWVSGVIQLVGAIVPGVLLFLVVPLVSPHRATPGQIAVWLTEADLSTSTRASTRQAGVRFAVRWLPILAASFWQPMVAIVIVALYETITVGVRRDRRSLSSVAAGTKTVTRRSLEAAVEQPAGAEPNR